MRRKRSLLFGLIIVCLICGMIRLWELESVPGIINGDESEVAINVIKIQERKVKVFDLTPDLGISYFVSYPKAILAKILGEERMLLSLRLVTTMYSLGAIIIFYFLANRYFGVTTSTVSTLLFGANYWFLNFSRLSWICVDAVFWGLLGILTVDSWIKEKRWIYLILAIVSNVMLLHSYPSGRIFCLIIAIKMLRWAIKSKISLSEKISWLSIFWLGTLVLFLPQLKVIIKNKEYYSMRTRTVYVFNPEPEKYYGIKKSDYKNILKHQFVYGIRGFFLFDKKVSGEGLENQRLMPKNVAAVNNFTKLLFWTGLILSLKRKEQWWFWLTYILNLLFLQLFSTFVPSWSRGLVVLPIIYLWTGNTIEFVISKSKEIVKNTKVLKIAGFLFLLILLNHDFNVYWRWVKSPDFRGPNAPFIRVEEHQDWLKMIRSWLKEDMRFNLYQWEDENWRKKNS